MNKTSSIVTGGITFTAATLVPAVQWALNGFPRPIPESVPYLVSAGLVTGAHSLYNYLITRTSPKIAVTSNPPAQPQ
ncbi:hypothetical protein [Silvimonas soli]|uniref:hypothetical protein n=1 Tax=Silvimonas soli TaxID=2980100 RepID=UPI0024B398EC|nr:hypothetical protein [Silvimonas soli]